MWPFTKLRYRPMSFEPTWHLSGEILKNHIVNPSVAITAKQNIENIMTEAVEEIAQNATREVITADDKYTVAFHARNIAEILTTLENRKASLVETMKVDREDFEAREAANKARVAEIDRLTATYEGALKIAHGGSGIENTGYGQIKRHHPVDSIAMTKTGERIAETRRRKPKPRMPPVLDGTDKSQTENLLDQSELSNEQKAKLKGIPN